MSEKKVPLRQCAGCREMKEKRELIRVVRDGNGRVAADPTGRAPGRGCYLCRNAACLERAVKTRALERSFGVSVPPEAYENIRSELSKE